MTVQNPSNKTSTVADGLTAVFNYDYLIYQESHMTVLEDGILTTKAYTVQGVGDQGGGTRRLRIYPKTV